MTSVAINELKKYTLGRKNTEKVEISVLQLNRVIKALEQESCEDWYDVPSNEMTVEQARQAVKDLRKKLAEHLEQEPCEDAISRQAVLEKLHEYFDPLEDGEDVCPADVYHEIKALPSVQPESDWIPIKYHQATEEEIEENGYSDDISYVFDNIMPSDGEEILITVKCENETTSKPTYYVEKDLCYYDDNGFYLDCGYDWITDVVAWRELPEPYTVESGGEE